MRVFKISAPIWSVAYQIPSKLRHKSRSPDVTPSALAAPPGSFRSVRLSFRYRGFRAWGKQRKIREFKGRKAYEIS
jgi:hypothetical protein